MTRTEILKRMQHFPKRGSAQIHQILTSVNGQSPVNEKTIGAILRKERGDKHGVLEIFRQITDEIKRKKEEATKELSKQLVA